MKNATLFQGKLVRLTSEDPAVLAKVFSHWGRNSRYMRLLDTDPPQLASARQVQVWIDEELEKKDPEEFFFVLRPLAEEKMIGFISLSGISWTHGTAWVGIGLGEEEYWGKGYGTDAMRLVLRYAFCELNLQRVSLVVFGFNQRAIRSYTKAGFQLEGKLRQAMLRDGERNDILEMGILRSEWLASRNLQP